jgi:hypothetical protein
VHHPKLFPTLISVSGHRPLKKKKKRTKNRRIGTSRLIKFCYDFMLLIMTIIIILNMSVQEKENEEELFELMITTKNPIFTNGQLLTY